MSTSVKGMFQNSPDNFQKYILVSAVIHVSVFLFFTVKVFLFPSEPMIFQSAVRVDLVALPDKVTAPAPAPAPAAPAPAAPAPPKAEPKPVEDKTVVLNPTKPKNEPKKETKPETKTDSKAQQQSIDRLKQMSAIEKMEEQFRQAEADKARQYKGNVISKGSDLSGISQLEHDSYVSDVEQHIRQFWAVPEWLASQKLKAQVRVRFDSEGNVIRKQLVKSSGNAAFDSAAMEAIDKSGRAPAPPERFVRLMENEGILFGFPE